MKGLLFVVLFLMLGNFGYNQRISKLPLDTCAIQNWPSLGFGPKISNNGKYVLYHVENDPPKSSTLIISETSSQWVMTIPNCTSYRAQFSNSSEFVVFIKPNDTLFIVKPETLWLEKIANVASFKLAQNGSDEFIIYQLLDSSRTLIVRSLISQHQISIDSVEDYFSSDDGKTLLFLKWEREIYPACTSVNLQNLLTGESRNIWNGSEPRNFSWDKTNRNIVFESVDKVNDTLVSSLWYFNVDSSKTIKLYDDKSGKLKGNAIIEPSFKPHFSNDGNRVFFVVKEPKQKKETRNAKVDIWAYFDPKLQSQQLAELDQYTSFGVSNYLSVIKVNGQEYRQLVLKNESIISEREEDIYGDYILVSRLEGNQEEWYWNQKSRPSFFLISTTEDKVTAIKKNAFEYLAKSFYRLSPDNKYVVYFDTRQRNYFAYEIATGVRRNLTQSIHTTWTAYDRSDIPVSKYTPIGVAGWLTNDRALLIYDQNDIWKIDPEGKTKPENITNGYGKRNNIVFKLGTDNQGKTFNENEKIILNTFDRTNKNNGYYSKEIGKSGNPVFLFMGPYIFQLPGHDPAIASFNYPLAAKDTNIYVVQRMSAKESPNLFVTKDFKRFQRLSDINPEIKYKWLNSELVSWRTPSGEFMHGILYKPDDFSTKNKYPIIFDCYERRTDELNFYHTPESSTGRINIPWFVSNGFLVFNPDIHFTDEMPGQSAYKCLVSATRYLSKFPWVNAKKMGLQGHSFGGYETNYAITHGNVFAAACSASGISDLISNYGTSLQDVSRSSYFTYWSEMDQGRMRAPPSEKTFQYIKNSPIYNIKKVNTPLLLMSNKNDRSVAFQQGLEFFTALRRLGKKVWLLQYDDGGHQVWGRSAEDFNLRLTQFFNHYLKDSSAPRWMTRGIPAIDKGIEDGYELDSNERINQSGLIPDFK
jgi:dipeptidyl aminopeptidase/acylaminoacyl peptidase